MNYHKSTFIYALCDPDTGKIRYIGKSIYPKDRFRRHIKNTKDGYTQYVYNWIRSLLSRNKLPKMELLEECGENWAERERWWIQYFRSIPGNKLTNLTDGGEGIIGYIRSEEWRRKMSKVQAGKTISKETRKKISETSKGRQHSKETREKLSKAHSGKTISKEQREQISKTMTGVSQPWNCKKVMQTTTDGVFVKKWASVKDAAKSLNLHNSNISACATGRYKTCGGFKWEYV